MKYAYHILITLCLLVLLPAMSHAQFIANYKNKGDTYFNQQKYYAAAVYYQKALKLLPDTSGNVYVLPYFIHSGKKEKVEKDAQKYQYLVYKLGDAFRLYKDYKSAEKWYAKALAFKNNEFPLAGLWYGTCLRANQKYEDAIGAFTAFLQSYDKQDKYSKLAALEIASCKFAIAQTKYPRLSDIEMLPKPVNVEKGSDYAAVMKGDTLYFTSSRKLDDVKTKKHNPYVNKIYRSVMSSDFKFSSPKLIELSGEKFKEEGGPTLNQSGEIMYLTEWTGAESGGTHFVIATSKRDADGQYGSTKVLGSPVNVEGYDTKQASISSDGKYLLFSSNRPGGSGGFDLWYCRLDENSMPEGNAINLGNQINTTGDDVNPYYDAANKQLTFSSDGRVGIGGFDLYSSKGNVANNTWTAPENMGYPVNSSKDDIFYYPVGNKIKFITGSDRNSVCCLDLFYVKLKTLRLVGNVYDKKTKEPLNSAQVIITDANLGKALDTIVTGPDGFYSYDLTNKRPLKLNFSATDYFAQNVPISTQQLKQVDTLYRQDAYLIAYEINKPVILPNILYDFDKATLRPRSKRVLDTIVQLLNDNPKMVVRISSHTDSKGTNSYNKDLSQRRAQSCVDYLISKGIPASRMEAKGYGETKPIVSNTHPDGSDNPEGRQLNRRTDFTVLSDADSDSVYLKSTRPKESELHKQAPKLNYKGYNYYLQLPDNAEDN